MKSILLVCSFSSLTLILGCVADKPNASQTTATPSSGAPRRVQENPQDDDSPYATDSVVVRFVEQTTLEERQKAIQSIRGVERRLATQLVPDLYKVYTELSVEEALRVLSTNKAVLYVEPNYRGRPLEYPNDPFLPLQWGLHNTRQVIKGVPGIEDADIDGPEGWETFTASGDFVVAVLDSGLNDGHPDLQPNLWTNAAEADGHAGIDDDGNGYIDDTWGWDFRGNDNDPYDSIGHGTMVSGIIAAERENATGVAGVANAKIMTLRWMAQSGEVADAVDALSYAVEKGVKVSNNSWYIEGFSQSLYDAIAASRDEGHLFVAGAGNDGTDNDSTAVYPASYDLENIISVTSVSNRDELSTQANYGRTSVDLGAPGVDIFSTSADDYAWGSGTSFSCAYVSGVVALVYEQRESDLSYLQIKEHLFDTTRVVPDLIYRTVTGGVVNLRNALQPPPVIDEQGP